VHFWPIRLIGCKKTPETGAPSLWNVGSATISCRLRCERSNKRNADSTSSNLLSLARGLALAVRVDSRKSKPTGNGILLTSLRRIGALSAAKSFGPSGCVFVTGIGKG
jgi:hypothetical protein